MAVTRWARHSRAAAAGPTWPVILVAGGSLLRLSVRAARPRANRNYAERENACDGPVAGVYINRSRTFSAGGGGARAPLGGPPRRLAARRLSGPRDAPPPRDFRAGRREIRERRLRNAQLAVAPGPRHALFAVAGREDADAFYRFTVASAGRVLPFRTGATRLAVFRKRLGCHVGFGGRA